METLRKILLPFSMGMALANVLLAILLLYHRMRRRTEAMGETGTPTMKRPLAPRL